MAQHSQAKRSRDIKTKLMAAVAMLLVASIMMVSTTYAWFTLSTAPEVTGITTSVGANGNLEMALLPTVDSTDVMYGSAGAAVDGIGNANGGEEFVTQSNVTWGNLVNLSDESYGLGKIVLYPSALNIGVDDATGKFETELDSNALLQIPTYGSDGRVSGMKTVSMTGVYDEGAFYGVGYGVRAVGAASGMSALELAFRNAIAAGNSAANKANNAASTSLGTSGTKLASMGIDRKLNDKTSYNDAEVQALLDVFLNLKSGALTYIDTALRNYIVAAYLSIQTDPNHPGSDSVVEAILNPATTWDMMSTYIPGNINVSEAINAYITIENSVNESITYLTNLIAGSDSHAWESFSTHAAKLVDISTMLIEGYTIDHLTQKDAQGNYSNIGPLVSAATSGKGLTMTTEGGIYAQIAAFCGNITASVKIENVNYNGILLNVNGTMVTNYQGAVIYLPAIKIVVGELNVPGGSGANLPISDYYGYAIDLAFRTNAAGSYLKLQSDGIDRVYSENEANDATMGHGATMTFNASGVTGYDATNVVNLMECYRVVFYNPDTMEIYGHARLDPGTVVLDDAGNYTMDLRMYDIDEKKFKEGADADKIVDLVQNEAKVVSVFVYLDGTTITNADVATSNITGKMNLQFASSAELTPMEYNDLRNGSGAAAATTYSVTVPEGVTGEATAESGTDYTFTVDTANYTLGTVTVGGAAVVPSGENGSYTIPAEKVTGTIVITVTPVTP